METYNFTRRNASMSHILRTLFFIAVSTMVCNLSIAQGGDDDDLKCEGHKNMSLGAEGCATLTSSDLHSKITTPVMAATYPLELRDENEELITDNKVDCSHVGQTLEYKIYAPGSTNSCWGTVLIEDKLKPEIECTGPIEVSCTLPLDEYPVPMVDDNCEVVSLEPLDGPFMPADCDEEYVGSFTRRWIATDGYGNKDTCVQEVSLLRTDLTMISWPANFTVPSHLECGTGFAVDENGNPDPSVTGTPMLGGVSLFPFVNGVICNGYVEYEDEVSGNSCVTQIMRRWTVGEWHCTNPDPQEWIQLIEIRDTEGPVVITCPDDITISTSGKACTGGAMIPLPTYSDLCGNSVTVNIHYGDNTVVDAQGPQVLQFPAGTTTVTFELIDLCLNATSTCTMDVTVSDLASPIMLCQPDLAVFLNSNGMGKVTTSQLNVGSFDECGDITLLAAKMTDICEISGTGFLEEVEFCCEEVGTEVMVVLQATDEGGLTNSCMVPVRVEDKLPARMICIPDMTINCETTYDLLNLSATYGFPEVVDNCPDQNDVEETPTEDVNDCGIGEITRRFDLKDASGAVIQTCFQTIIIEPSTPLEYGSIVWPRDYNALNLCGSDDLDPESLPDSSSVPIIPDGFCNQVGFKFSDELFEFTQDGQACFKILRTWKVIDWCRQETRDDDNTFPTFEYEQIIKVGNNVAPTIMGCEDITVESADSECGDVQVELIIMPSDDCTPADEIDVRWTIDPNDDGMNLIPGTGPDASGAYPIGRHKITWEVFDKCGNTNMCEHYFTVRNIKAPQAICLDNITTALIPMDMDPMIPGNDIELVMLTPDLINKGSKAACDSEVNLSFSADAHDDLRTYGCVDVGVQDVELWVTDQFGNKSFCRTIIEIIDSNMVDLCGEVAEYIIVEGDIMTEMDETVEGVKVRLDGSELDDVWTADNGYYQFMHMGVGTNYSVIPQMESDDILNGVSTLDIVLLQRHLLGIDNIDSPYRLLAGDVNNSGSLTASDILLLRKIILGVTDEFGGDKNWMFVDSDYTWDDASNPWEEPYAEQYDIDRLESDMVVNFTGVKMGDLNNSAYANARQKAIETRSNETVFLTTEKKLISVGEHTSIDLVIDNSLDVSGIQLVLDIQGWDIKDVRSATMDIDYFIVDNELRIIAVTHQNVDSETLDITLDAEARSYADTDNLTIVHDSRFSTESYIIGDDIAELKLRTTEENISFTVAQNRPNPWTDVTGIDFYIPEAGEVEMGIYDVSGRVIYLDQKQFSKGENNWSIDKDIVKDKGVYIYKMKYADQVSVSRMIHIR